MSFYFETRELVLKVKLYFLQQRAVLVAISNVLTLDFVQFLLYKRVILGFCFSPIVLTPSVSFQSALG